MEIELKFQIPSKSKTRLEKFIKSRGATRYFLLLALVCSQSWGGKVYADDCRHWLEIGTGVVALHSKGGESLRDVLSYIDQYLSDSQIPAERRQQLLDRSRQVWDEGLMFGHDLEHQLLDKCDVQ